MKQSLWQELIGDNPAIRDKQKLAWQRLNPRTWTMATGVSIGILLLVYGTLVAVSLQGVAFMDGSLFMFVSLVACLFTPVIVLYGTIAGEKEKRTLDLLLVAPLTARQIIAAKVVRVLVPLFAVLVLLSVPIVAFSAVRLNQGMTALASGSSATRAVLGTLMLSACVSVFMTGVSIWISSVNKTTAGALTGILAVIFLVYVVYAVTSGVAGSINREWSDLMLMVHPFVSLAQLAYRAPDGVDPNISLVASSVVHFAVGALLLWLATNRLERDRAQPKVIHA